MALPGVEEKDIPIAAQPQPESNRQPVWHVIALSVLTIFVYPFFWFYKNLKQLKVAALAMDSLPDEHISPPAKKALTALKRCPAGLFTFALLIPFFHILLCWQFFAWCAQLYPRKSWIGGKHPALAAVVLTTLLVALLSLGFHKGPGLEYLFALNAAFPLAFAQHLLNGFWKEIEPQDRVVRGAFSGIELISLIFGGVLLGLVAAGASMK
ncbi:MAG TPA: hypothetical protein V6C81_32315 [Planktothrix sp.]|jgi:hypothetical protein